MVLYLIQKGNRFYFTSMLQIIFHKKLPLNHTLKIRSDEMIIYTVKQGDTLENIANEKGVTVEQILNTNFPPNPDNLVVGQKLVILVPEVEYIVEEGIPLIL